MGGKQSIGTEHRSSDVELHKDLKVVIINTFKQLKKIMFKELKKSIMTMTHQRQNTNMEPELIKKKRKRKKQVENLDMQIEIDETGK